MIFQSGTWARGTLLKGLFSLIAGPVVLGSKLKYAKQYAVNAIQS